MKIAIIGAGISGLSCAYALEKKRRNGAISASQITVFESNDYFGGHAHSVPLTLPTAQGPLTHHVDTGFLVYNERTYPGLIALFAELGVATTATDMSFAVSMPHIGKEGLEWAGSDISTLFAQKSNLMRPGFWRMVRDIIRFNRQATKLAHKGKAESLSQPLGAFLETYRYSAEFRDWYLLPMMGCIWSCPTEQMMAFPASTLIRFCFNHGLLQINNRPRWFTVTGGSHHYVSAILKHLSDARLQKVHNVRRIASPTHGHSGLQFDVFTDQGAERFDQVIFACHSDQALALLDNPTAAEKSLLGAIKYQPNRALLHGDAQLLPTRKEIWSAWNFSALPAQEGGRADEVCVHYLLNHLQPLPAAWGEQSVIVSLNPLTEPDPALVWGEYHYAHPVFDEMAIAAQADLPNIQGTYGAWYCGAWTGYGFHEDGLKSGQAVANQLAQSFTQSAEQGQQAA